MPQTIADQYRLTPYPSLTHPFTHPSRVRAVAALYGLQAPDPAQARILELGVNQGANLHWIARSLPAATCIGLDLTTAAIRQAQQAAQAAGLTNLTYHAADLLDFDFGAQKFDYIGDTDLRLDWMEVYPKEIKAALVAAKMPRLKALQYADYLFNTTLRSSLVCRTQDAQPLLPMPALTAVLNLHVASRLQPKGPFSVTPGLPMRFQTPDRKGIEPGEPRTLEVTDPVAQRVLSELARQHNRAVPMAPLWARVSAEFKLSGDAADTAAERIGRLILHAVCRGQMAIYAGPYQAS